MFQNLVNKMWIGFDPASKAEIRTNLNQVLLLQHKVSWISYSYTMSFSIQIRLFILGIETISIFLSSG